MKSFNNKIILFLSLNLALLGALTIIISFYAPQSARSGLNILKGIWFVLFAALCIFVRLQLWKYKPRSMKGQFGGFKWVANIFYDVGGHVADVEIRWFCPIHKVILESKELVTLDSRRHALFCPKCGRTHNIKVKNEMIPFEEAQIAIKQDILFNVDN